MNVGSSREVNSDASDEKVCLQPFGSDKVATCLFVDSRYEAVNLNRPIASNNALTTASYYFIFLNNESNKKRRETEKKIQIPKKKPKRKT